MKYVTYAVKFPNSTWWVTYFNIQLTFELFNSVCAIIIGHGKITNLSGTPHVTLAVYELKIHWRLWVWWVTKIKKCRLKKRLWTVEYWPPKTPKSRWKWKDDLIDYVHLFHTIEDMTHFEIRCCLIYCPIIKPEIKKPLNLSGFLVIKW